MPDEVSAFGKRLRSDGIERLRFELPDIHGSVRTNDRFASTPHRMINDAIHDSGREPYSAVFFFDPNFDAGISGLAACLAQGRCRATRPRPAAGTCWT